DSRLLGAVEYDLNSPSPFAYQVAKYPNSCVLPSAGVTCAVRTTDSPGATASARGLSATLDSFSCSPIASSSRSSRGDRGLQTVRGRRGPADPPGLVSAHRRQIQRAPHGPVS